MFNWYSLQLVTYNKLSHKHKQLVKSKTGFFLIIHTDKKIKHFNHLKPALKAFLRLKHPEIDDLKLQRIVNERMKKIHPGSLYMH